MPKLRLGAVTAPHEHFEQRYQPQALQAELAGGADMFTLAAPVDLSFEIDKDKADFRLAGRVQTTVELSCSRCLERFTWPIDALFDLTYRPLTAGAGAAEREIEEEDFSTAFYENDEIDLGELIRERLYLSVPMKPLCHDACKGLCPQCGVNRNREACGCRDHWVDPRLAALHSLKSDS